MRGMKKYLTLILALTLCLTLAACGGSGGSGGSSDAPDSFEGLVKDPDQMADFGTYAGAWRGEDGSTLLVELAESGDELRFALYDTEEYLTASGSIQYVPEYGFDYFYNEHDGVAYRTWSDESGGLHVDTLGTFAQMSGDIPGGNDGTGSVEDYSALAGVWLLDAEADAASIIEIDQFGSWSLSERPGGDGDPTEVDRGTLEADPNDDGRYYAVSSQFEDVTYDVTVVGDDVMYWGGENDYYQKMA